MNNMIQPDDLDDLGQEPFIILAKKSSDPLFCTHVTHFSNFLDFTELVQTLLFRDVYLLDSVTEQYGSDYIDGLPRKDIFEIYVSTLPGDFDVYLYY